MRLTTPHTTIEGVVERDLQEVFSDQALRGNLVVLATEDDQYLQAAGEGDGPYLVEHRDAHCGTHQLLSLADTRQAFIDFLNRASAWNRRAPRPSEKKIVAMVAVASTLGTICSLFI